MKTPFLSAEHGRQGSALVIVLAFIVLLTSVMLVFLSQAMSYRNLSNTNFNDLKSAQLGQSALAVVVGDMKQEIVNGSTPFTYGAGTSSTNNLYLPLGNTNAVPQRSGNPALIGTVDPVPNLIRVSTRTETYAGGSPAVGSRASAVSSTNAAYGGQYIGLSRWNKHYLIPRASAGSTSVDTTPTNSFIAPDWVYVTGDQGPKALTVPSTKVVGRYAYAIYDEGGLLDANVAGYPSGTAVNTALSQPSVTNSPVNWGAGMKGTEAFADLTVTSAATGAPMLTQTQIDQLVAWRNNATIQATGSFTNYTIPASSGPLAYHNYSVSNTNGFLVTSGTSVTTGGTQSTDQAFTSRQALINYAIAAGWPQDTLQYLATFTRDTEQPTYVPPVGRPMVQSATNSNVAVFGAGNDAYGVDRVTTTPTTNAPTDINPPLLSVRVTTGGWIRADGSVAQAGEPLIKERFPLSRLSYFPTKGNAPTSDQAAAIYKYFGLTYNTAFGTSPSQPEWFYNHDSANTAGIDRLQTSSGTASVLSQNREPDFFELLKTAINVGSLGKGACYTGWPTAGTEGTLVQGRDNLTGLQILQIGANIIDQSKADNFPTSIQFPGDPTVPPNVVRGSEDLPYLYRIRNWITHYSNTTPMMGALLIQPELWDPYSYNSGSSSGLGSSGYVGTGYYPTNFRVRMIPDPSLTAPANPITFTMQYALLPRTGQDLSSYITVNASLYTVSSPAPLTFNAGDQNGTYWGFREPTLLGVTSMPGKCNLAATPYTDVNTGLNMTGLLLANFPWTSSPLATTDYAYQFTVAPNGNSCIRLYLEYQDSSGNWKTYDEAPFQYQSSPSSIDLHTVINYTLYNSGTASKQAMTNLNWLGATRTDPRASRWGLFYGEYFNSLPIIDAANNVYGSYRADSGISFGTHQGGRADGGFVYAGTAYGKQYRGFQHGYWEDNTTRSTYENTVSSPNTWSETAPYYRYNRDPDGVARRAMGGYVTDTANGGQAPSASQPLTGMPMAIASGTVSNTYAGTTTSATTPAYASRPTILHRPFRSVAELGYAFRDTPWGNINFTFPESGDLALLDVFCVNDSSPTYGQVAGRVNLNTRQAPVLAALLSGSLLDKDDSGTPVLNQAMASDLGKQLVARTSASTVSLSTQGPLMSRADLVGAWRGPSVSAPVGTSATSAYQLKNTIPPDPNTFFTGFSYDIGSTLVPSVNSTPSVALIPRQRDAVMRALVDSGATRTWNLLVDLIAQSGRFSSNAVSTGTVGLSQFVVEGEKHYWLHVAIDRYTGKVVDSQLEVVKE